MSFPPSPCGGETAEPITKARCWADGNNSYSERVYNYGPILLERLLTALCVLGKASWTLVSMVALTPGTICHQIITFKTPEKKVSLSSQYSQKSRLMGEPWLELFPVGLG